jgi:hypothetical protein
MGKLMGNPLTSPLRGLSSGELMKMFSHRHLGLGCKIDFPKAGVFN